ncbi:hypothetical protein RHSIM_Rhsim02G0172800 [Rhododendron simsii]|uniref:Uncharacterized protein n=1 Tax=Rhododendron simsii TaxID=118357 RepID=A0A834HAX9_RHOSS|nr:hypothetical protein RHSIM_Rhsim02G0172800 [Rhododendron simsii]
MASNMSSSNSGSMQRVCGQCGSGPSDVRTSRSSMNPGRSFYYNNRPCDKWNGWCDESLPSNASVPRPNETHGIRFELSTVIPMLTADIANLKAENREILNSEIEAEDRGMTQLSNNSLRNIAAEINAMTGEMINLKQCKNRYGILKQNWQTWILLADSRKGATGLGMNPVTGVMDNPGWGNSGSANDIGRGHSTLVVLLGYWKLEFTRKNIPTLILGMEGMNFPTLTLRNEGNELGLQGLSDNVPRDQQFVEQYNSSPHLHASSNFQQTQDSRGHGTEPQARYDNWEWMNNNNGNVSSSTNVFDGDNDSKYSIPANEFYVEIAEDELLVNLATLALLHAIQILHRPQRLSFHTCLLSANIPWYEMPTQVEFVLALMAIHNYIRRDKEPDDFFTPVRLTYEYVFEDLPDEDPKMEDRLDERDDIVDEDKTQT